MRLPAFSLPLMLRWGLVASYMGVIYYLSSQPTFTLPSFDYNDKVAHFLAYSLLGFLLSEAISESNKNLRTWEKIIVGIVVSAAYGALDEYHQSFVPGRSPSVFDFLADTLGACFGCWVWSLFYQRKLLSEINP